MFVQKWIYIFKVSTYFCWEIVKFFSFLEKFYLKFISDPELTGSGMFFPDP